MSSPPELSREDKELIFKIATRGFVHFHCDAIEKGMSDTELEAALVRSLGIFGGSGGPGKPSVSYQGSGLKIWGAWETINHVETDPLFQGKTTLKMAREIYKISDPTKKQMDLF